MTRGGGDIVERWETRGDLIARGYTSGDAEEAIAFGVFLRRTQDTVGKAEIDYASGQLNAHAYLEQVAPEELTR